MAARPPEESARVTFSPVDDLFTKDNKSQNWESEDEICVFVSHSKLSKPLSLHLCNGDGTEQVRPQKEMMPEEILCRLGGPRSFMVPSGAWGPGQSPAGEPRCQHVLFG